MYNMYMIDVMYCFIANTTQLLAKGQHMAWDE